jgi:hypothetical protein
MATKKRSKATPAPAAPLVRQQPRSKQQAAAQAGLFLYTDDRWAQRYFDPNDLHNAERELLG